MSEKLDAIAAAELADFTAQFPGWTWSTATEVRTWSTAAEVRTLVVRGRAPADSMLERIDIHRSAPRWWADVEIRGQRCLYATSEVPTTERLLAAIQTILRMFEVRHGHR